MNSTCWICCRERRREHRCTLGGAQLRARHQASVIETGTKSRIAPDKSPGLGGETRAVTTEWRGVGGLGGATRLRPIPRPAGRSPAPRIKTVVPIAIPSPDFGDRRFPPISPDAVGM